MILYYYYNTIIIFCKTYFIYPCNSYTVCELLHGLRLVVFGYHGYCSASITMNISSPTYGEIYFILFRFVNRNPKLAKHTLDRIYSYVRVCADCFYNTIVFFLYPVTEREKALRQEREQKELTIIWLRVSSTCCVNKGFLVKKILSSTFKSVDDEYIQCDVVYINVLVDSSYPRTASLLISARFVVNTIFVHYFRYCTIVVTTRCRSQYYN